LLFLIIIKIWKGFVVGIKLSDGLFMISRDKSDTVRVFEHLRGNKFDTLNSN